MANISDLNTIVTDLFGVISTLIGEVVTLMTGDLLVLAIVGAFVGLIIGLFVVIMNYVKSIMSSSTKMKK